MPAKLQTLFTRQLRGISTKMSSIFFKDAYVIPVFKKLKIELQGNKYIKKLKYMRELRVNK